MATPDGHVDALCVDLGSDGLALRCSYVPRAGECIDIEVRAPGMAGRPGTPLRVSAEVRRCNAVGGGMYEIGFRIVRRLG